MDKALTNMQDSVKGALDIAKSARSKAVTIATAVTTLASGRPTGQTYAETGTAPALVQGNIVGGAISNSTLFQSGDVFRADIYYSVSKTTQTRFFRAATTIANPNNTGASAASAIEFSDVKSLADALNKGFGTATANFVASKDATTNNWGIGFSLGDENKTITFGQTLNGGTPPANDANFDFSSLFGRNGGTGTGTRPPVIGAAFDLTGNAADAATYMYGPLAGTGSDQNTLDIRKDAADFFRQTIYGLSTMVNDASLPGYANILNGETMTVDLNETGSLQQNVKLSAKIDFAPSFNVSRWGVGFTMTGGVPETSLTLNDDFKTNARLDQAITSLNNIYSGLKQDQSTLAAAKVAMNSRLDYNK
ncbi:hypothetical protein WDZ92_41210, partial [Nostoc sp. NIES-2111]